MSIAFTAIKKWFNGKWLKTIETFVIPTLVTAEQDGYWPPNTSRQIKSALNKQNVAIKFARANERQRVDARYRGGASIDYPDPTTLSGLLDDVRQDRSRHYFSSKLSGHDFVSAMEFGSIGQAPALVDVGEKLVRFCVDDAERAALAMARQWADDFAPIAALIERLDATRPKPTFVIAEISPTVHKNVAKAMAVDYTTIRMPEVRYYWIDMEVKGQKVRVPACEILWPDDTRHGVSRFSVSRAGNRQCEACGHAIQDPFNWLPLLADTATGPVSLWVGRDCGRKLFGVAVKGDVLFRGEK